MSYANPPTIECQQCHQKFVPKNWRPTRETKYCSRPCRDLGMSTRVILKCRQCGKDFERKAYMADWSQERGPFCGFECYGAWQQEHTGGPDNPNFVPRSTARAAGEWARNRLAVLERDGYQCMTCGRTDRLHVHHRKGLESIRSRNTPCNGQSRDTYVHRVTGNFTSCTTSPRKVREGSSSLGIDQTVRMLRPDKSNAHHHYEDLNHYHHDK